MKNWNKGRFGFWFHTKKSMRNRDAVMTRIMEAQGGYKERERIIKLLEADKAHRQPHCSTKGCEVCPVYEDGFNDAITLIKGQNK